VPDFAASPILGPVSRYSTRSISVPIVLSSIAVLLTLAVLIGWIFIIRENLSLTRDFWGHRGILVAGILSLALVMCVLVLFSVSLVREILEGRRQQMFIDSVTHELKSPLASIRLCLDTLDRDGVSQAQQEKLRRMMRTDTERLMLFVDDILQASRIAHRLRSQTWMMVDVPQVIRTCIDSVRRRYELPAEAFSIDAPETLETCTDPTALEIILKNVIDNAVKYSSGPPRVEVTVEVRDTGHLLITVRDHGIGVERRQLRRIFRRFHRAPDPEVNERSGSGLGLYVVQRLARNLGGRVRADSDGPGRGTSMYVRLPRVASTHQARQA